MKQIIGYIENDFMIVKRGFWYMAVVFTIVSAVFSINYNSAAMAMGYMLFGGLVLASTLFTTESAQTVSFSALVPGSTWQKVVGRYLGSILAMILFGCLGLAAFYGVRLAGFAEGGTDLRLLAALAGIGLFFLAVQNVLLYLCLPLLGVQAAHIVRMVPGFIMFFLMMQQESLEIISGFMTMGIYPELILLGIGILSLLIGLFFSYLIQRRRIGK